MHVPSKVRVHGVQPRINWAKWRLFSLTKASFHGGFKKYDRIIGDPIMIFLEEAHRKQRNNMMDNFPISFDDSGGWLKHLLQSMYLKMWCPSRYKLTLNYFVWGKDRYKFFWEMVKFTKRLLVYSFFLNGENITFTLFKSLPHAKYW